ncbi:hypothetical protein PC117_g13107 [Phytophthora cactorum]|uniref:Uncharacterized protein n=1 Tax=Phytophthora cactorum TaxID=29920 RepID=A0A8T1D326_9STRA|nr:hypothetical protein PC117_g13107 [Phytophthora cactorum]
MPGHNTEKLPPPAPSSAKDKDHQLSRKSVSEPTAKILLSPRRASTAVAAATTSATGATSGAAGPGATDAHVQSEDIAQAECVTEMTNPKDKEVMEAGDYIRSVPTRLARAKDALMEGTFHFLSLWNLQLPEQHGGGSRDGRADVTGSCLLAGEGKPRQVPEERFL